MLHLSRMRPPAPRPHHRRIARAILDEAAQRLDGQVFALRNTDLVLLLRRDRADELLATLAKLFHIDVPDPTVLLTSWSLADDGPALLAYARARLTDRVWEPPPEIIANAGAIDAIEGLIQQSRLSDLMQRQTAVLISPGAGLQPLFREITFSVAVLEARIAAVGQADADPFLFRHLASRLDVRMLEFLRRDLHAGGSLTAGARGAGPTLNVNLTVSGILSETFAGFAATCRSVGADVAVEVPLMEACGDPEGFTLARDRLRLAGLKLVLDSVSHYALMLTMPAVLQPDLVKLEWSAQIPESGRAVPDAIKALGPGRVVLHRAETEAALAWGMTHGIRRFQGRHVDAMLAAERLSVCAHGQGCGVRQCVERASATGPGGRAGCLNPVLLDGGTLPPAKAVDA